MSEKNSRPLRYIRKNFEWTDYLETHYTPKAATNDELRIDCIVCDDRKKKLYVNPEKRQFNCFKCGFSTKNHDVFDFVAHTEGMSRAQSILKLLREYKPVTPENIEDAVSGALDGVPEQAKKFKIRYLEGLPKAAVKLSAGEPNVFWDYLIDRGLTAVEIQQVLQAHAVLEENHVIRDHRNKIRGNIGRRILWPVYGGNHQLVSWQARIVEREDPLKYLNCPDTDLNATLWPYAPPYGDTVILVEGALDAIAVRRLEKTSAYATFSKAISNKQLALLESWGVQKVIMAWDMPDAKKETERAVEDLMLKFDTYVATQSRWPKEMDCGDCLSREDGLDYLHDLTQDVVSVSSLDYVKWLIDA